MHAKIPCTLTSKFDIQLDEGGAYEISNFFVNNFIGKYKCLNDDKHIVFSFTTTIVELPVSHFFNFEEVFQFTDLGTVDEANFQDRHCIGNE